MGNGAGPQLGHDGHSLGIRTYGAAPYNRHSRYGRPYSS
ncbi:hypothetical protein GZL_04220 [Streptomyces sp. 769]|nr:hypothetical protein GZL_04220 [Streptomyces sp. 769]